MDAAAIAAEEAAMALTMDTILQWIGFESAATRNRLHDKGLNSFDTLRTLDDKDITRLDESFGRRAMADGCAIFGLRCTRLLIRLVHLGPRSW